MWKSNFYKIISDVDNYSSRDQTSFYSHTDTLYDDILALQLMLVNNDHNSLKYNQSHLITFALTAYCDERLNTKAISLGFNYEMLQTRLFKTLEAGKVYYGYLEYILTQRSQANIDIYWVYYYLLIHGYKGMYDSDNYFERSLYLRQLKLLITDHIPLKLSIKKNWSIKHSLKKIFSKTIKLSSLLHIFCLVGSYVVINYL